MKPKLKHKTLPAALLASIGSANLTEELTLKIGQIQQKWQGVTARTLFAVGPTGEFEFLTLSSPLDTPLPETAKNELREIARLLAEPPQKPKPPRFPPPRDDWREVIAGESCLRELIEASPVKNLLTGENNCEAFADAMFAPEALIKVKGRTVVISTRDQLRGKLQDFPLLSPFVLADREEAIKAKPYQVLFAGGSLDSQAKRISFVGKTFPIAAIVFDGKSDLEVWYRVKSDDEREKLLSEWATLSGDTQGRPWARMPGARRTDLMPSHAFHALESAGLDELIDRPRGIVRLGYEGRQTLLYLSP